MKNIQLACSPLSWMNSDIPELGRHIPLENSLKEISEIGFEGVEFEGPYKKILDQFPELLKKYNLGVTGGWHSTHLLEKPFEEEKKAFLSHMEFLSKIGGDRIILAECTDAVHQKNCPLSKRPKLAEYDWKTLCEQLDELAQFARDRGFITAYHPHMGTVVQSAEDIERLMDHTRHLGLLIDTGHLLYAQADPHAITETYIERVSHVHCKNVRPDVLRDHLQKDASFFTSIVEGLFTVPGDPEGAQPCHGLDFEKVVFTLVNKGYRGWVLMEAEQDPVKANPYKYAKMGFETLDRLFKKNKGAA